MPLSACSHVVAAGRVGLLSTFENISVFFKALQVRLQQVKHSFSVPRIDARSSQADYAALLLLYEAPPFGDELLGAAKIVFGSHLQDNAKARYCSFGSFGHR
jgi:hypothetical protein